MNRLVEAFYNPSPTMAVTFAQDLSDRDLENVLAVADVAEFRVDLYPDNDLEYLIKQAGRLATLPLLVTNRTIAEGGNCRLDEYDRGRIFLELLSYVDGLDVELDSELLKDLVAATHQKDKIVIASTHNFVETPTIRNMYKLYWRSLESGADFVKLAFAVNTPEEFQRLVAFTISHREENLISVGMGKFGPLSRIILPALGSRLTYAHAGKSELALGQMDYLETISLLHRLVPDLE